MIFQNLKFEDITAAALKTPFATPEKVEIFNRATTAARKGLKLEKSQYLTSHIHLGWEGYKEGRLTSTQLVNYYKALAEWSLEIIDGTFNRRGTATFKWYPRKGWHPVINLFAELGAKNGLPSTEMELYRIHYLLKNDDFASLLNEIVQRAIYLRQTIPSAPSRGSFVWQKHEQTGDTTFIMQLKNGLSLQYFEAPPHKAAISEFILRLNKVQNEDCFEVSMEWHHYDAPARDFDIPFLFSAIRRHEEAQTPRGEQVSYTLITGLATALQPA